MEMEKIKEVLNKWAADKAPITKVYIFGSRVKGDFRPDSDLDVALELYPIPGGEDAATLFWMTEEPKWKSELQPRLPYILHLHYFEGDNTPTIKEGIRVSGVAVYNKNEWADKK